MATEKLRNLNACYVKSRLLTKATLTNVPASLKNLLFYCSWLGVGSKVYANY